MISGNFSTAVKGVLHLPESGYRIAGDGSGVVWLVGESDSAGATSPCFEVALPEIKGYIVRGSAEPYPGAEPSATFIITLKDRFGGSWTYSVTSAGSADFKAGNPAPALDGPLELSIDTLGAASKKVRIALFISETPTWPAATSVYVHPNHSGDVTSVSDGAQTIAADAVTYAKMQNVSATDKVLGRSTAGAGDVEEIPCTASGRAMIAAASASAQLTLISPTTTQGDIIVRGASVDARLGIGTKGQLARVNNAATALEYVNPLDRSADRDSILAQTITREQVANSTGTLTSGTLLLSAARVRLGVTIAKLGFVTGSTGATNPTNWWLAIYDTSLNLLNNTADQLTAAIAANTVYEIALTSSYTPTEDTTVYFGLMVAAATPPFYHRFTSVTGVTGIVPMLGATSTAGLTTTPPNPAGALTAITSIPWLYGKA